MGLRRTSQSIWGVATSVAPIGGYLSRADTTPCQSGKGTGRRPRHGTWRKRPHMCTGPGAAARDRAAANQGSTVFSPEGAGGTSSNGRKTAGASGPASGRGQAGKAAARAFVGTTRKPAQPASAGQSGPSHGQRAQDCGTGAGLGRGCSPGSYGDRRWWFSITTAAAGRDWAKGATGGHSGRKDHRCQQTRGTRRGLSQSGRISVQQKQVLGTVRVRPRLGLRRSAGPSRIKISEKRD